jgi:hypothetical protein
MEDLYKVHLEVATEISKDILKTTSIRRVSKSYFEIINFTGGGANNILLTMMIKHLLNKDILKKEITLKDIDVSDHYRFKLAMGVFSNKCDMFHKSNIFIFYNYIKNVYDSDFYNRYIQYPIFEREKIKTTPLWYHVIVPIEIVKNMFVPIYKFEGSNNIRFLFALQFSDQYIGKTKKFFISFKEILSVTLSIS